jgi:predicted secreted Zn-dependent protease
MRFWVAVLVAFGLVAFSVSTPAKAKPKVKTKYVYYSISGQSARTLYEQMVRRGPHVNGERALASTTLKPEQTGQIGGKSDCRVRNYRLNLDFTIRLPKAQSEKSLSPKLRKHWRRFYQFVRAHEQRHRAIWINCARRIEKKVRGLRARTCAQLGQQMDAVFTAEGARCERQHDAFDTAEQKRLARHPLVRAAKRTPREKVARTTTGSGSTTRAIGNGRSAKF